LARWELEKRNAIPPVIKLGNDSHRHHEQDHRDFRTSQSESEHGARQSD